mmetsp:Transcript_97779/g.209770  ORF Transcript_97779/g.209770 Transcript_97779/m.209770 type:complete len:150 (+) Transcript_97779:89-538(+)
MAFRDSGDPLKHTAEPYSYSSLLDGFSQKRRAPLYTISKSKRFPPARSSSAAAHLGPGQYRVDSDFAHDSSEHLPAGRLTRSRSSLNYTFGVEDRRAECGTLKGTSSTAGNRVPNPMSPGSYSLPLTDSYRIRSAAYAVPRARTRGGDP